MGGPAHAYIDPVRDDAPRTFVGYKDFADFAAAQLAQIAQSAGVSYETLSADFGPVNPPVALRTPAPPANGARRALVVVHYTPFAPRLAATPASDPARWAAFSGPTPLQALRRILDRVEWSAHGVEAVANLQGEVALYRRRPETSPAIISQGLSLVEVQDALAALRASSARAGGAQ